MVGRKDPDDVVVTTESVAKSIVETREEVEGLQRRVDAIEGKRQPDRRPPTFAAE
jgi:polyhydroxyalkanoate synthesis regulator phasin